MLGNKVHIIFICEPGTLEYKSLLLAYSLHINSMKNLNVAIPKTKKESISQASIDVFKTLGANIFYFENRFIDGKTKIISGDLMSNKFFAIQQSGIIGDVLFLDSDIICLQNFNIEISDVELLAKPVDISIDINWDGLLNYYKIIPTGRKTVSTIDKRASLPYFNGGVLYIKYSIVSELISWWKEFFLDLSKAEIINNYKVNLYHRDQIAFALAVEKCIIKFEELPLWYNFPVRRLKILPEEVIFAHYHDAYTLQNQKKLKDQVSGFFSLFPESKDIFRKNRPWRYLLEDSEVKIKLYKRLKTNMNRLKKVLRK